MFDCVQTKWDILLNFGPTYSNFTTLLFSKLSNDLPHYNSYSSKK